MKIEDKKLTANFRLSEFLKSETADKKNIDNTPNQEQLDNIVWTAQQLQLIRNTYKQPMFITSGFRSEALNSAINGAKNSYHKRGLAVDINQGSKTRNKNLFLLVKRMMKLGLPVDQVINEKDYSWVHIGFARENPRLQVLHLK